VKRSWRPLKLAGLANANLKLENAGGRLPREKCLEAARTMPHNRLAGSLLTAVGDPKEVAAFIRKHPGGPAVPSLLAWLSDRAKQGATAEKLIAEGVVPRAVSRAFYAGRVVPVKSWQVVGPFSNEADVALRRAYPPEKSPALSSTYVIDEQEVGWKVVGLERDNYVNLGKALEAADFKAGYAMCWVRSAKRRRAWLFVETPNVVSAWIDEERVLENVSGGGGGHWRWRRSRRGSAHRLDPVPVTLRPGWNRITLKVAGRWGYLGFKLYLGGADGAPLKGLEYSTGAPKAGAKPGALK
jgi:hypothetical protein